MRNDPHIAPQAALHREFGHRPALSRAKWDILFQPIGPTGVPLGGLGTGGITRSSDGRFSRWTLKGGGVRRFAMPANGFALRVGREGQSPQACAFQPAPDAAEMSAFAWEAQTPEWRGLFPFAWHRHRPVSGVTAECLSFSPFTPGDIATSSLPVAVFRWRLTNTEDTPAKASLAFHLANMNGWFDDFGEGRPDRAAPGAFNRPGGLDDGACLVLDRRRTGGEPGEGDGEWAIAVTGGDGDAVFSSTTCFDGTGGGAEFWEPFVASGDAPDTGESWVVESGFRETPPAIPAGAVCARVALAPGETRELSFSLVWDLPVIRFGQGRKWYRAYTDQWGREGRAAEALARHVHANADDWQRGIATWHEAETARLGDEPHRAGMAINETYFLVDGLAIHTSARGSPDGRAHFGLIECHDYALYNTLDLWVYAAESVGRHFPELAASVAADYADQTLAVDPGMRRHRWDGTPFPINPAGSCPHDLGGPAEDPFVVPNSYTYRDGTVWKDLNCDMVLCLYRDGQAMDADWRRARFPAVRSAIDHLQQYDSDGDGLIENDGTPDQTFDNIPMKGPSSYCGGLWIAALRAGARLAEEAGETIIARAWEDQAEAATEVYDRLLFDGRRYRVDTEGPLSGASFVEQLFGPYLARRLGLGDIVPEDHARSALADIVRCNFREAGGGEGAVSLADVPDEARAFLPHQDDTSFQTAEIQPGFNFSLAAQLESWGLWDEAQELRRALYRQLYVERNLVFQTPAAFDRGTKTCRAILNMRPLAVWWMEPLNAA